MRLAIAPLLALALAACKPAPATKHSERMPEPETLTYRACNTADDCVYIQNGCCDCVNGGQDIAVAKAHKDAFEAQFECSSRHCTEAAGKCGRGEVTCEEHVCRFRNGQFAH
jgi:hypothetical protein